MANIEEKIETLISDTIINLGYILYDIEYEKVAKDYFLRIFIDKEDGIDLEDCEIVSNSINNMLDESDYIKEQYFLEVSSTGIEKKLTKDWHLEQNIDKDVEVRLFKPIEGNKEKILKGKLHKFDKEYIEVEIELEEINIERKNIALIKTIYNWERNGK